MNQLEKQKQIIVEREKKLKRSFLKQKLSAVASSIACLAFIAQLSFAATGFKFIEESVDRYKESEEYKAKIEMQTREFEEDYQNGKITLKQLEKKIDNLSENKTVIKEIKQSEDTSTKEKLENGEKNLSISGLMAAGIIVTSITGLALNKSAKKDESDSLDMLFR